MKKLIAMLTFCSAVAFGADWTGYISETHCGAKHNDGSADSINCVKGCIKGGAKPVLVVGDKVVNIANADKVPEALYGLKVKVHGTMKGDDVEISSIAAAK
jgi:hypothetical protein